MRLTRKIPGIRLPIPGQDGGEDQPAWVWPPGIVLALVFVFLITAVFGLYVLLTIRADGSMAVIWLEPHVLGLSNYGLLSLATWCLVAIIIGRFLLTSVRRTRWKWKRVVVYVFVLGLLALNQTYLNGSKRTAQDFLDSTLAHHAKREADIALARKELDTLGDHAWAGEYVAPGTRSAWATTRWLTPNLGHLIYMEGPLYSPDAHPARRACDRMFGRTEMRVEGDRVLLDYGWGPGEEGVFLLVPWGERRYLVQREAAPRFWAAAQEAADGSAVPLDGGIQLRVGDEWKPVTGLPELPARYRSRRP